MAKKSKRTQGSPCVVEVSGLGFVSALGGDQNLFTFSPHQALVFHDFEGIDRLVKSLAPQHGNRTVRIHFLGDMG